MAYDKTKVQFTAREHEMAARLDAVIEGAADGFQARDLLLAKGSLEIVGYLAAGGDRAQTVKRLYTLAVMLERDNDWLVNAIDNAEPN
jgi:hypothetical protein